MELEAQLPNEYSRGELVAGRSQNKSDFTEPRKGLYRDKKKDSTSCATENRSRSREKIEGVEIN